MNTDDMKAELRREGYSVVKNRTYARLQERAHIAERQIEWERQATKSAEKWGRDALAELRRIERRLTFVYGEARAAGCSIAQLANGKEASDAE